MDSDGKSDDEIRQVLVQKMQEWGHRCPFVGYGVPKELKRECRNRLDAEILAVLDRFMEKIARGLQSAKRYGNR